MTGASVHINPVTPDRWPDMARLFEARGAPHYCWCMVYRAPDNPRLSNDEKRDRMAGLVSAGTPVGLLAYDGDDPVGWCSVAPRETYLRLERSRAMPRIGDAPTWAVLCFFVRRSHRQAGVGHALLAGAVEYARNQGAQVIEGYPWDTAGVSSRHRGHSALFRAAGFTQEGKRWVKLTSAS